MKIKFDPNQRYQIDAMYSIVDLFDGQSLSGGSFEALLGGTGSELLTELGVGNALRLGEVGTNPQQFMEQAGRVIRATLNQMIIDGIKYERIEDAEYEMMLFEEHELLGYLSRIVPVEHSIYDAVELDSDVERSFALALDQRSDIKLFIKLPGWFKIDTPLGSYNPDWAIVKQSEGEEERLYLIRETKGSTETMDLRSVEAAKLRCGQAHFDTLDVDFKTVTDASAVCQRA